MKTIEEINKSPKELLTVQDIEKVLGVCRAINAGSETP